MLGRRNLRVKVMQTLYAWEMDRDLPTNKLQGQLETQIQRSVLLYLTNLQYLVEVCNYSMVDKAKRLAKYIQTEADAKASTTIAANRVIVYLQNNNVLAALLKKEGIPHNIDEDIVKTLFQELSAKERYNQYAALTEPDLEQDKDIVNFMMKKVFSGNKSFEHHLEELFPNFDDDNSLLQHVISKFIEGFSEDKNQFLSTLDVWAEEKKFALELLTKSIAYNDELNTAIEPNLKNWDMDRVAILDLILMKQAVCELLYFPTVPIKVTINEYIDISKMYSTPKSKDFVNGVLDKVKNQLLASGAIKKTGRGLME
jgi:N utilization substance protein B